MYRLGEREHHHRKLYILLFVFALIIVGGGVAAKRFLVADTSISGSGPAVVTNVSYDQTKQQKVDTPYFSMSVPASWKPSTVTTEVVQPTFSWQGTVGEDRNRWISVFIDQPLTIFAVNRALHIQENMQNISVIGSVSDNCTSFTGAANTQTGKTPAKWEGIDFLCDTGNYERNVTGIVSPDGLNNINLSGTGKGPHKYFFTYTDNTNQPDYTNLTTALKSLKTK